ncbi:MAG: outer membrane protein assembly factor BamA [Deltaproteobacteria bacterium]|nr:outer membrane protein assembly factor BamA [Deltaproteobacteria bacterium]NCP01762.1 outer membrane protein assembly factor BamA [Deltaproteobacteria bacterium]NCP77963.1 outer membrane protein assembly factor BamA [Desulfuromonadales bacterium]
MWRYLLYSVVCLLLSFSSALAVETITPTDVRLEGNNRVDGATVRALVSVKPGAEVTLEQIDRDVRAIAKLGHFDDVRVDLREEGGRKILVFVVHERPLIREIRFEGFDHLSEEKLRPVVLLKPPVIYDPVKVANDVDALLTLYQEEGYHAAKIAPDLSTDERNESLLTFKITEGDKVLIDEIVFEGNEIIASKALRKAMQTRERWIFSWITDRGTYKPADIPLDMDLMQALYFDRGYMDARIKQPQISLIKDGKYMKLLFEIDEGPQYRVGKVGIKGDLLKPRDELLQHVTLKEGDVFSRSELRASVLALTDLYADEGYANVNVVPLTSKDVETLTIDLNLDIEQGPLIHIEKIRIAGNTVTRDKVIRRELTLIEGDKYSATKIRNSRNHLRNLGFFEETNLSTSPGSAPDKQMLDINITEKPTGTFSIGAGYSSVDHLIAQGSVSQGNLFGYGINLRASATLGGSSQLYQVGVTDPYFLDSRWTAGIDVYKTERDWSDFSESATGGAVKVGRPLSTYARGLLTYRYEEKEIYDIDSFVTSPVILDQEGKSTLSSLTASLSRNTTDYHLDPSRGGVSQFSVEYAGLGGTEDFAKFELSHRHFFPLFWKLIFSLNGDIGYVVKTTNEKVPVSEKFFLGGLRSIRGFDPREVGPEEGGTYIGGEKAAYMNAEILIPLSQEYKIKGVLFYDAGNAWRASEDYFNSVRQSVGYGIRWLSPLGPLRFEWGYNLDPQGNERSPIFEFSIGTFF